MSRSGTVAARRRELTFFLLFLLCAICGACRDEVSQNQTSLKAPDSVVIKSQADFERSRFCNDYGCAEDRHWPLRSGDIAHTYNTNYHDVEVDLSVSNSADSVVTSLGVTFFDQDRLSFNDFGFIAALVRSTNQSANHHKTISFIRENVEHKITCRTCQLDDSDNFVRDGDFHVWAGKVGEQQTVIFKRVIHG